MKTREMGRTELLERLRQGSDKLDRFVVLPEEILKFRPDLEDAWTIKEHVVHMADAELILYSQARLAIAQPGQTGIPLEAFIRGEWNVALSYNEHPLEEMVEAFKQMRFLNHYLLSSMAERDWAGYFILRPNGDKRTLEGMLGVLDSHPDSHAEFIERNMKLWKESPFSHE